MHGPLQSLRKVVTFAIDLLVSGERKYLHVTLFLLTTFDFAETKEFVSRKPIENHINGMIFMICHKYSTIRSIERVPYLQHGKLIVLGDWYHLMADVQRFALQTRIQGI